MKREPTNGAFTLSEIVQRFRTVRTIGLETIVVILVPSYLVHANWFRPAVINQVKELLQRTDAIGWFIAVLIIGSIFSIERRDLISGLAKIILPLGIGSIVGAFAGTLAGVALGSKAFDAFFLVVVPVLGGGVTAGALPLSVGYTSILGISQADMLAVMLPSVILGNFAAVICAGLLDGYARMSRNAGSISSSQVNRLVDGAGCTGTALPTDGKRTRDVPALGAAVAIVIALYASGSVAMRVIGLPAPLTVLSLATVFQLTNVVSPRLRTGILTVYRFSVVTFTYPVLFVVGLVLTPWQQLVEGLTAANLAAIVAAVGSLSVAGFLVSRWIGLDPVDGAIITLTRAAMGGTGDVTILNAGRRVELMSFAQISTRIGGAATVAMALLVMGFVGR
jgi:malate:Na+ symporter